MQCIKRKTSNGLKRRNTAQLVHYETRRCVYEDLKVATGVWGENATFSQIENRLCTDAATSLPTVCPPDDDDSSGGAPCSVGWMWARKRCACGRRVQCIHARFFSEAVTSSYNCLEFYTTKGADTTEGTDTNCSERGKTKVAYNNSAVHLISQELKFALEADNTVDSWCL